MDISFLHEPCDPNVIQNSTNIPTTTIPSTSNRTTSTTTIKTTSKPKTTSTTKLKTTTKTTTKKTTSKPKTTTKLKTTTASQAVMSLLAKNGDCQFYKELENIKKCGSNGYPIAYGYKYCVKFGENINTFNDDVCIIN